MFATRQTIKKEYNKAMDKKIPRHVSIIMDGNGRWAQERGKERVYGHANGVESVRACVEAAAEEGVEYLSLFAFSEENWNRPEAEVSTLMSLMVKSIANEAEALMKQGVRVMFLGNRSRLAAPVNDAIDGLMEASKDNKTLTLIIFISYSGKWDILEAAKKLAKEIAADPSKLDTLDEMDINSFDKYFITAGIPDPDLMIRTSGEMRISNYMLWQLAYTEILSVPTLWPDFRKPEFRAALAEYAKRDRRYGKVK